LRALDWLAAHTLPPTICQRTSEPAVVAKKRPTSTFRRKGYVIIARNYRSAHHRGELDLVGWTRTFCVLSRSRPAPPAM